MEDIKVVESDRRSGDPPILVGSSDKAENFRLEPRYLKTKKVNL